MVIIIVFENRAFYYMHEAVNRDDSTDAKARVRLVNSG